MTVKFLLFRGNWENEGKFYALETENTIVLLAAGQDYTLTDSEEQELGCDYLQENRSKLQAIIINNTSFRNIGLLTKICQELGNQIPVYASVPSKLIIHYLYPQIRNHLIVMTPTAPEILIGDFTVCFMPLNSYLLGNYAISLHYSHYSFYLIEEILLHNYWENELLFHPNFHPNFSAFLNQKKPNTYLITSFNNIKWQTNNSLFLTTNNFFSPEQVAFWILYEFDWLHILELLEMAQQHGKKVRIWNEKFLLLVRQILARSLLGKVIDNEGEIILLVVDYNDAETRISDCLKKFSPAQKSNFHFLLGIPPVVGSEEKLARIVDFLHTQSSEITNLSKKESFVFGTSLADWKLVLQLLQPQGIILLQNSYKSAKHLTCLPNRIFRLPNQCFYQFPNAKFARLRVKRSLATLEEILVRQRKGLQEDGLLIIFFLASWQEEKLELKKLRLELIGISSQVNLPKLENKIKTWWDTKLVVGLQKNEPVKIIKEAVKKRCSELAKSYLSSEHDIDLEELPVLVFLR